MYELLKSIDTPQAVRELERSQLHRLANELRQFLIELEKIKLARDVVIFPVVGPDFSPPTLT